MSELDKQIEKYITDNTATGENKSVKLILDEFIKRGYTKNEIFKSLNVFSKNHCSNNTDEYDT